MITLVARLATSAVDARRGVVRLHPEVLDALHLRSWEAVTLTGGRVTSALAVAGDPTAAPGQALLDDVTLSNAGLTDGASVVVGPVAVAPARRVVLAGSRLVRSAVPPATARLALLGKVLTAGDAVSLLPQDIAPPPGADVPRARRALAAAIGGAWTSELVTVSQVDPPGPVSVHPTTVVGWLDGPTTADSPAAPAAAPRTSARPATQTPAPPAPPAPVEPAETPLPLDALVGNTAAARRLVEWLELTFSRPELLVRLGGTPRLGVLVTGPEGVGKTTLVRSVAAAVGAGCVELPGPAIAALEPASAAARVQECLTRARGEAGAGRPVVLLVTDVDALLPAASPPPLATLVLDGLREAIGTANLALVATTAAPEAVDPRLRAPDLADRELGLALPDAAVRADLLRRLLADVPLADDVDLADVASRTPGFVVADLAAVRREAAVTAALRHGPGEPADVPAPAVVDDAAPGPTDPADAPAGTDAARTDGARIEMSDLLGAVGSVRPISMSSTGTLQTGGLTLDQVGDMAEVKQALTEAVLWPLRYPDSFARLGVEAPRGVLLYGPPGGGKTFLLRALAGSGQLNVFSVKGAELLDKYVGESERAVRELFRKASDAAPALVFLDEVDALAPRRGGSTDSGVADRVVAALLTELDGATPLREVVVVGATNRPELVDPALLRPGRLERLVFVPPPDAEARADILRAAGRNTPLAGDVDLDALAADLEGYSAADCAAVLREAALTAMRESLDATEVTAAHLDKARRAVPPSLDPVQVAELEAYAARRASD
ncbi:AAA family ATPase [Pseudonocardia yuanmonensis]|uniref:AAA family ATPase n=1 Tax=Pseudonocardia yuanmonensis TaxID=1095914 RepID=UPI003CD0AC14